MLVHQRVSCSWFVYCSDLIEFQSPGDDTIRDTFGRRTLNHGNFITRCGSLQIVPKNNGPNKNMGTLW